MLCIVWLPLIQLPNNSGTVPEKELCDTLILNIGSSPISDGREPVKWLSEMIRFLQLDIRPISDGRAPIKLVFCNWNQPSTPLFRKNELSETSFEFPASERGVSSLGKVPVRKGRLDRIKRVRFSKLPKVVGTEESKLLSLMERTAAQGWQQEEGRS